MRKSEKLEKVNDLWDNKFYCEIENHFSTIDFFINIYINIVNGYFEIEWNKTVEESVC